MGIRPSHNLSMHTNTPTTSSIIRPVFSDALRAKLDTSGPRYTSYPTADRFNERFGPLQYSQALQHRVIGTDIGKRAPFSVYLHIPFCESLCYYCACNKIITKHHERAMPYLDALETELDMHVRALGRGQPVSQIHFGGGTPTFLSNAELERLMASLRHAFSITSDAEISIEVDPRTANRERLASLQAMGFNRLSFGVQDFDETVQKAVHRIQSYESVRDLMEGARELGYTSINMDLIYGLPFQTAKSFATTLERVRALRPDRIALYAYAHLPTRFKPQRRISEDDLPSAPTRLTLLQSAINGFLDEGYVYIGMDHFALPDDTLAKARQAGRLQRNFQGYSTHPDCDIIALGVSAIGRIGPTYSQNVKTLDEYYARISQRQFAIERGLKLTRDDLIRRAVIMELMCQGRLDYELTSCHLGINPQYYFATELSELDAFEEHGLLERTPQGIQVTPTGWFFIRAIAMTFDYHIRASGRLASFSRIV